MNKFKLEKGSKVRLEGKPYLGYGIVKDFVRDNVVLDWHKRSGFVREIELDSSKLFKVTQREAI